MKTFGWVQVVCCLFLGACLVTAAHAEIAYDYYTGEVHNVPDFSTLKPTESGKIANFDHTLGGKAAEENYSIQFHGGLKIEKDASYTFYVASDDGSKLWIDDKLVVDNDGDHATDEKSGKIKLAAGLHKLVLGFYQGGGERALTVSYECALFGKKAVPAEVLVEKGPDAIPPAPVIPGNLSYDYYESEFDKLPDFSALTPSSKGECDGFDFLLDGKARGENYAIRFSGNIKIEKAGDYTFYTNSDDGSRLLVDEKAIVENDGGHPAEEKDGKVTLTAGSHKIAVLYYQHGGERSLHVSYSGPDIEKKPIPDASLTK
jgi:hypothetical protein